MQIAKQLHSPSRMSLRIYTFHMIYTEVQVSLRGRDICMPHHLLDRLQICSVLHQMSTQMNGGWYGG